VNPFLGFFFSVNYALGGVILALPYSFLHAGLLIAIPTMLAVAFVGWINATWVLEVMARAQVGFVDSSLLCCKINSILFGSIHCKIHSILALKAKFEATARFQYGVMGNLASLVYNPQC